MSKEKPLTLTAEQTKGLLSAHRNNTLAFRKSKVLLLKSALGLAVAIPGTQIPDIEFNGKTFSTAPLNAINYVLATTSIVGAGLATSKGRRFRQLIDKQGDKIAAFGITPPETTDGAFTSPDGTRFLPPTEARGEWVIDITHRDFTAKGRS